MEYLFIEKLADEDGGYSHTEIIEKETGSDVDVKTLFDTLTTELATANDKLAHRSDIIRAYQKNYTTATQTIKELRDGLEEIKVITDTPSALRPLFLKVLLLCDTLIANSQPKEIENANQS